MAFDSMRLSNRVVRFCSSRPHPSPNVINFGCDGLSANVIPANAGTHTGQGKPAISLDPRFRGDDEPTWRLNLMTLTLALPRSTAEGT
jgi:hypothetical protein